MTASLSTAVLAWLATYAIHSTLLLGGAWLLSRRAATTPAMRDVIWKVALVGGILTSLVQHLTTTPVAAEVTLSKTAPVSIAPSMQRPVDHPSAPASAGDDQHVVSTAVHTDDIVGMPTTAETPTWRERLSSVAWSNVLVTVWAALAALLCVVYVARRLVLTGRLENRRAIIDGPLPAMLAQLCRDVQHRSTVRLTSVNTIASPVALGAREICLPEAVLTQLSTDEQRSLLAHELAHLTRRDPAWLALGVMLERVFFFQPLNRVARVAMQRNAELVCDDWAASQSGSGLPLAQCLARVAEWMEAAPLSVPVAGMAEQRSLLVTRVARLLEGRRTSPALSRSAIAVGTLAVLAVTTAAAPVVRSTRVGARGAVTAPIEGDSRTVSDASDRSINPPNAPMSDLGFAPKSKGLAAFVSAPIGERDGDESTVDQTDSGSAASEEDVEPNTGDESTATRVVPQDTAVVSALIERLKDRDPGVRAAAASSLGRLKSRRAVNALIAALDDGSKDVRVAVMEALAELEDRAALPALMKGLTDGSADVRLRALDGLEHFSGEVRASALATLVKDGNSDIRRRAISLLGETTDRTVTPSLVAAVRDGNAEVRVAAIEALAHIGDASVVPSLTSALADGNREVRRAAVSALCELDAQLPESLMLTLLGDEHAEVRTAALEYLKEHPTVPLVSTIRKLLDDDDGDVREMAVEALAEYRDPAAREALRAALRHEDPKVRRRAADALGDRR